MAATARPPTVGGRPLNEVLDVMLRLPESIAYLQDAIDDLAAADPGEVDESFDDSLICAALKARISGVTDVLAIELLKSDKTDLDGWLEQSGHSNGHFLSAYISSPDALVPFLRTHRVAHKRRKKRAPRPAQTLSINPLPGFSYTQERGGIFLQDGDRRYGLSLMRSMSKREIKHLLNGNFPVKLVPISFGDVTGYRMVIDGRTGAMLLTVQGKDVTIYIDGNPSALEAELHSLKVVDLI